MSNPISNLETAMDTLRAIVENQTAEVRFLPVDMVLLRRVVATPETAAEPSVTVNGYQLKNALEFIAPDGDADQLESDLTIQWGPRGHSGVGYYAFMTEYPDEGSILLDNKAPESPEKTSREPLPEGMLKQGYRAGKLEDEPQSCTEADGCPTELAVLKRYWRASHARLPPENMGNGRAPPPSDQWAQDGKVWDEPQAQSKNCEHGIPRQFCTALHGGWAPPQPTPEQPK